MVVLDLKGSVFRQLPAALLLELHLCVHLGGVMVPAFRGLVVGDWWRVIWPFSLKREQTWVPLDGLCMELRGCELQLFKSFLLGLKHGLDSIPFHLMFLLLVQGPLLQKQSSPLTLLKGELYLRPLSGNTNSGVKLGSTDIADQGDWVTAYGPSILTARHRWNSGKQVKVWDKLRNGMLNVVAAAIDAGNRCYLLYMETRE